jgi:hypothetical protein
MQKQKSQTISVDVNPLQDQGSLYQTIVFVRNVICRICDIHVSYYWFILHYLLPQNSNGSLNVYTKSPLLTAA